MFPLVVSQLFPKETGKKSRYLKGNPFCKEGKKKRRETDVHEETQAQRHPATPRDSSRHPATPRDLLRHPATPVAKGGTRCKAILGSRDPTKKNHEEEEAEVASMHTIQSNPILQKNSKKNTLLRQCAPQFLLACHSTAPHCTFSVVFTLPTRVLASLVIPTFARSHNLTPPASKQWQPCSAPSPPPSPPPPSPSPSPRPKPSPPPSAPLASPSAPRTSAALSPWLPPEEAPTPVWPSLMRSGAPSSAPSSSASCVRRAPSFLAPVSTTNPKTRACTSAQAATRRFTSPPPNSTLVVDGLPSSRASPAPLTRLVIQMGVV